jgi:hypothetical protein
MVSTFCRFAIAVSVVMIFATLCSSVLGVVSVEDGKEIARLELYDCEGTCQYGPSYGWCWCCSARARVEWDEEFSWCRIENPDDLSPCENSTFSDRCNELRDEAFEEHLKKFESLWTAFYASIGAIVLAGVTSVVIYFVLKCCC